MTTGVKAPGSGRPWLAGTVAALLAVTFGLAERTEAIPQAPAAPAPDTLEATGLYADFAGLRVDPKHLAFAPQYPLWTDGATKRRWVSLPPGAVIDGSDPDAWVFPVGTRLWKEFSFGGRRVETRYLERRADGRFLYAVYVWSPDGREARLAPDQGLRGAHLLAAGGRSHTIPGVGDCKACHQGGRSEVLGFSALQLSPDRDPGAPHAEPAPDPAVDLRYLAEKGLVAGLPESLRRTPPRIAARSETERAALGYLHGNCGHCHNERGSLKSIGLFLGQRTAGAGNATLASVVGHPIRTPAPGQSPAAVLRVEPRHPERSGLMQRVASRYPPLQMPPLGSELVDAEAVALLQRWIAEADEPREDAHLDQNPDQNRRK